LVLFGKGTASAPPPQIWLPFGYPREKTKKRMQRNEKTTAQAYSPFRRFPALFQPLRESLFLSCQVYKYESTEAISGNGYGFSAFIVVYA